jgi:phospholipase D1/2
MSLDVICEGKTCWTIVEVEQSAVLIDAEAYYASFCAAALLARRSIYITGWQFDTHARLLRPAPDGSLPHPVELLEFLNYLCERTPELEIFLTAWDYSVVYALEREWLQKLKFDFRSHERVHFEFLNHPEGGGCHHQKLAIVDGQVAFLGGLDLCDARWDTRHHRPHDPGRLNVNGDPYKAFHDIQVAVRGPVLGVLSELFAEGWARAKSKTPLPAGHREGNRPEAFELGGLTRGQGLALRARRVAVCRTDLVEAGQPAICEVQALFESAILGAQRLIYIETQYFTSRAIAEALCRRLADAAQSKLELVLLMPNGADSPKEDFVLGNRQRAVRRLVAEVAKHHGHELRVLMSSEDDSGSTPATFIHSKLMIVDDEFVTIGSANLTNRSMRVDRELNVAYAAQLETEADAELLRQDIRALRASLLAEHAGVEDTVAFEAPDGLIARLDQVCGAPDNKLHCQPLPEAEDDDPLLVAIFDPSQPLDWSNFDTTLENAFDNDVGLFRRGVQKLGQRLGAVDIE